MNRSIQALLAAALLCIAGAAGAQTWPARPVKVIVAAGTGLAMDIAARMMSDTLSRSLGQQMFVENIPGASGIVGAQAASRATPDGYTIFFTVASTMSSNKVFFKTLPYDAERDFIPVSVISDAGPFAVSVNPDLPVKTLPELIAMAKAQPGKLSYAVDSSSGYSVIVGQLLNKRAGIEIVEIPYKSTAQMLQDAAGGTVQLMISSLGAVTNFANAGKVRRIAISSSRPFPGLDVPTISQTLPGFNIDGWLAVVAPTGTPAEIVRRLNREINQFLSEPDVIAKTHALGIGLAAPQTPEQAGAFFQAERAKWQALAQELNIQPQ